MENSEKMIHIAIFSSVGYICAGTAVSLFAGIALWSSFLEMDETVFSLALVITFILSACAGLLLIRYLVPKIGAKSVYDQDILVAMIGMLLIALSINTAMLFVGVIICSGALAVFFYENFSRQLHFVKELSSAEKSSKTKVFYLSGWALGPVISVLSVSVFSNLIGVLTLRLLFAHFIVISFWLWIQRLGVHEKFADAPTALLAESEPHSDDKTSMQATAEIKSADSSDKNKAEPSVKSQSENSGTLTDDVNSSKDNKDQD